MSDAGARVLVTDELERCVRMPLYRAGYDIVVCRPVQRSVIESIIEEEPDILLFGAAREDMDPTRLVRRIRSLSLTKMPAALAVFPMWAEEEAAQAEKCGALSTVVSIDAAAEIVEQCRKVTLSNRLAPDYAQRDRIEEKLRDLSINPGLTGFHYLADAIELCARDQSCFRKLTTQVYPAVGCRRHAGRAAVERLIRHAIEAAWLNGDIEKQYACFGNTIDAARGKPTNSEFIARVTEALRLEAIAK